MNLRDKEKVFRENYEDEFIKVETATPCYLYKNVKEALNDLRLYLSIDCDKRPDDIDKIIFLQEKYKGDFITDDEAIKLIFGDFEK